MQEYNITVMGLDIAFRAGVDEERIIEAKTLAEDRFEKMRVHGGRNSKEMLLTFLVLGFADDLLQSRKHVADVRSRVDALLAKIEELA